MEVTFLGTGTSQGVPVIACKCRVCQSKDSRDVRLRSSVLIRTNGQTFVIDSGPDFRQQMLRARVRELSAIIFTHEHKDHVAGLDDVRAFNFIQQRPMDIYCEQRVLESLQREFAYVFAKNKYPGVPKINIHLIENKPFEIVGVKIIPIRGLHYRLPVLGYRIGNFSYVTDLNHINDDEIKKMKGTEVLCITALRKEKHLSHFSLDEALAIIRQIQPRIAYLTHLSHQFGKYIEEQPQLPDGVFMAYDGLTFNL